jgi:hypothetical protein
VRQQGKANNGAGAMNAHETLSLPLKFDAKGKIVGVKWGPKADGWHDVPKVKSYVQQDRTVEYKAGTVQSSQEEAIAQENTAENEAGVGTLSIPNNQYEVAEVVQDLTAPQTKEESSSNSEATKQSKLHPEYNRPSFQEWVEQQKSQLHAEAETGSISDISSCCSSPANDDWATSANDNWVTQYQNPPPPTSITQYSAAHNLGEIHLHPDTDIGLTGFATTKLQISSSCQETLKANQYRELCGLEQQSGAHILAFDPFRAENGDVSNTAIVFIQGDPFARHQAVKLLTAFQMNLDSQPPESNANFSFLGPGRKWGTRKKKKK